MNTTEATFDVTSISSRKVLSLIGQLLGGGSGNPDPDNPMPHGPWDPYIRRALEKMGPHTEPWKANHHFSLAELNPQPLPPRTRMVAALTQEVIDHSLLINEIAEAIHEKNEERSIIIVSGKVDQYLDDFDELCRKLISFVFPQPPKDLGDPEIHPNWAKYASALEWLIAAAVFQKNAASVGNKSLSKVLMESGAKFAEIGFSKMDLTR